ncbi:D-alanyl-D-alanine carboxypeptidase family protein [Novosphingobium album (ex Liu et al. 2023)]|uniref:serine-type D-Ala-D-Ala carboxypeptidase n=1 Tax=Novosphingobium album (ex Liu et al. 2023) TaxID=3031130 RepID=A0ABT5WPF2_9SPHN|nr:D-alanyl-D-alanine carboxypeptidase family protein [Novosphingobium album (ex Liu et al. 2023)]MDE8651904.1 D-alanyl-D-alanine carboxypeptidase [Novosphingobium album (ex Liu et al. 2023)]
MKRVWTSIAALALWGGAASAAVPPPPPEVARVPVTMLVDLGSGQVLEQHRADARFAPASMTKVMTAYVAFEEIAAGRLPLRRRFAVRPEIAREWYAKGTSMYLRPTDTATTDELLHGIMTASANDAAVVLAREYAGSVDAWTFMMNDTAKRLGMSRTHYATANGWPDGGRTHVSARDLARLAEAMIVLYPRLYHRYAGQKHYQWRDLVLTSHDPTVGVVPGADGIKTGYTRDAGYCFLGSAERDGRRLVMVVAGAPSAAERDVASRALLEWGFAQWHGRPLFAKGKAIGQARVQDGAARTVRLIANRDVYATLPKAGGEPIRLTLRYDGPLQAPIRKGARVAELEIRVGGTTPGRIPLYAATAVERAGPMDRLVNGVMNLFS